MNIDVLCTSPDHPVVPELLMWARNMEIAGHNVSLLHDKRELRGGDILFLVSCGQVLSKTELDRFHHALVLHASDLPKDRGWSPHIWTIVEGGNEITVSLIEAGTPLDSGSLWAQKRFVLEGHELLPEINRKLFAAELELMSDAVRNADTTRPVVQAGDPGIYRRRRAPEDSRLDPAKSIAEQFNLLRVVDNERYPAFFELHGNRYVLKIEKADNGT